MNERCFCCNHHTNTQCSLCGNAICSSCRECPECENEDLVAICDSPNGAEPYLVNVYNNADDTIEQWAFETFDRAMKVVGLLRNRGIQASIEPMGYPRMQSILFEESKRAMVEHFHSGQEELSAEIYAPFAAGFSSEEAFVEAQPRHVHLPVKKRKKRARRIKYDDSFVNYLEQDEYQESVEA